MKRMFTCNNFNKLYLNDCNKCLIWRSLKYFRDLNRFGYFPRRVGIYNFYEIDLDFRILP